MLNEGMREYDITNIAEGKCSVCKDLTKVYNLEANGYEFNIPKEIGHGYFKQIVSYENIQIIDFNMTFHKKMEVQGISKTPHIDMFFCVGDGIEWEFEGNRDQFELSNGESFFAKAKNRENIKRCTYLPERNFNFMEIKIHPKKFHQITENIEKEWNTFCNGKKDEIFYRDKITPSIQVALQQILNCPYENGLKNIYMEGKILEILAIYLNERIYQQERHNSIKLSNEDVASLYKAKEILDNNLVDPPTLTSLSKMICLNEFKLKNGFKEIFGDTVYAYVIDKRLETARLLLEKKNMQVSEVVSLVGYANASHFASAFRKKFGVNPKEYLQNVVKQ